MKVTLGKLGLNKTFQESFPKKTTCCRCGGISRIGFVAHEGMTEDDRGMIDYVCDLHENKGIGSLWVHDCCVVAVYFCRECLEPTALYNQA